SCYFFVRPRRSHLQLCVFLGRAVRAPQVRRVERTSKAKLANIVHVTHRDEVESPITDWLREAYELPDRLATVKPARRTVKRTVKNTRAKTRGKRTRANPRRRRTVKR